MQISRKTSDTAESANVTSTTISDDVPTLTQPEPTADLSATDTQHAQDSDAKSEMSYDPLFDDESDADGEPNSGTKTQTQESHGLSVPSSHSDPSIFAVPSQPMPQPTGRLVSSSVAAPKNAPPLLDPVGYSTFSPDVLMTASIDGQVILWDKRVNTPKKGVGRLEMSEKTPPWCVSVSPEIRYRAWALITSLLTLGMLVL